MTRIVALIVDLPMEGPKEDSDGVGHQGDDVYLRADLADCHIDWCCKNVNS